MILLWSVCIFALENIQCPAHFSEFVPFCFMLGKISTFISNFIDALLQFLPLPFFLFSLSFTHSETYCTSARRCTWQASEFRHGCVMPKVRGQGGGRKSPGYRGIWRMKDRQCFTVVSTAVIYLCAKRMLSRSSSLLLFFCKGASGVHMFVGSSVFGNCKKCVNLIVYLGSESSQNATVPIEILLYEWYHLFLMISVWCHFQL